MRTLKAIPLILPPDLPSELRLEVERNGGKLTEGVYEWFERRAAERDPEGAALLKRTQAHGRALGITCEEDVERMIEEYRRERRA